MTTIVAATDLSSRGAAALARARSIAVETGSELAVVHVTDDDLPRVSSHARRGPVRGLLGSVSSVLIRAGNRDLLIAPRLL